jgi:MFS family permease
MLFRFSLYGLLKNQRYFEPFLILVFLEKGLSFFQIGLLVAFREVAINIFEIPSGAVADLWGRRRAMVVSFCAYIASFLVFALARDLPCSLRPCFFLLSGRPSVPARTRR